MAAGPFGLSAVPLYRLLCMASHSLFMPCATRFPIPPVERGRVTSYLFVVGSSLPLIPVYYCTFFGSCRGGWARAAEWQPMGVYGSVYARPIFMAYAMLALFSPMPVDKHCASACRTGCHGMPKVDSTEWIYMSNVVIIISSRSPVMRGRPWSRESTLLAHWKKD